MFVPKILCLLALAFLSANISFALTPDDQKCMEQCRDKCAQEIKRMGIVTSEDLMKKAIENCAVSCGTNVCKISGHQVN